MSDLRKDKPDRPFYELPTHIKPCSKIIQETRLQLNYGPKTGQSSGVGGGLASRYSSVKSGTRAEEEKKNSILKGSGDCFKDSRDFDRGLYGDEPAGGPSFTSIRPVHTQRPKTGVEHDMSMLWGVSSRKRPPSAITLSRLSIDTSEEDDSSVASSSGGAPLESVAEYAADYEKVAASVGSLQLQETSKLSRSGSGSHKFEKSPLHLTVDALRGIVASSGSVSDPGSGRAQKSEIIAKLQDVKMHISHLESYPDLKSRLLRLIFKIVEKNQQDEDLLFWASFVLLHCGIMGNNLTTVFKMVFKASRCKEYWRIMRETEYLGVFMESFGQICPITQTESMIYGYGTLKFICVEKSVLLHLIQLNLISVMTLHLKLLNYEPGGGKKGAENILNGVFQLTSIFRNVVGEESSLAEVVSSGLLTELVESLAWTTEDIDVLSNIVRILSVVSGSPICSQVISATSSFPTSVVKIMENWYAKEDVIVRLSYTLGNLLAHSEHMRMKLFQESTCYTKIIKLLHYYLEKFNSPPSEDILIKTVRILANWSLNPMIGSEIAETDDVADLLNVIIKNSDQQFSDELLLCVIATLNNISFYKDYEKMDCRTNLTAQYLINYLEWENQDGRIESMKVLGNLTRNPGVRDIVAEHVKLFVACIEAQLKEAETAESNDALSAAIGVLMNVIVSDKASEAFMKHRGVENLVKLLETRRDVGLHLMVCQFLWNILVSAGDEETKSGRRISKELRLLIVKLINDKISNIQENHTSAYEHLGELEYDELSFFDMRTEFISVASRLCEKLAN